MYPPVANTARCKTHSMPLVCPQRKEVKTAVTDAADCKAGMAMDASLIAIGTRADTTNALSSQATTEPIIRWSSHRHSEAEGDQTERALASESRPAKA